MILAGGLIMIAGRFIGMFGMMWEKTADLLAVFGYTLNMYKVIWVIFAGLAMMLGGWGLMHLGGT